jgi:hypothetical protein
MIKRTNVNFADRPPGGNGFDGYRPEQQTAPEGLGYDSR